MKIKQFTVLLALLLSLSSCYNDDPIVITEEKINKDMNLWIHNIMQYYYYWNNEMPDSIYNYNLDPVVFFKSLLYSKDKFSSIIPFSESTDNSISIVKNYGFESIFGYINENKTHIGGLVLYVYPNSIAEKEGIKRGDIFTTVDDILLTKDNLVALLQKKQAVFTFMRNNDSEIFSKNLYLENHNIHPIYTQKIIELKHSKIGYLCYNQFIEDNGDGSLQYVDDLLECFSNFKKNDINELIIDFRYNPGGLINLSVLLSSLIVPNIDTTKIALQFEYNQKIESVLEKNETIQYFSSYPNSYIGNSINRVFFIVGPMTASASEAVINALSPYMEVIMVGETTYGKNYGSMLFTNNNNTEKPYSIMPIVLKTYDSNYESDYDNGFIPDYQINEFAYPLCELGDEKEPLLNYILSSVLTVYPLNKINTTKSTICSFVFHPIILNTSSNKPGIYEFRQHED